jgi:hypothetical protein
MAEKWVSMEVEVVPHHNHTTPQSLHLVGIHVVEIMLPHKFVVGELFNFFVRTWKIYKEHVTFHCWSGSVYLIHLHLSLRSDSLVMRFWKQDDECK